MTGFNSKRQAAWNKFAEKWQGIAKWKDPELNPIDTVQPTAWQWLDSGNFRKKIPKHSNPSEWNPLYKSPAAQPAQEPVDNDFFKSLAKKNQSPDQRPWIDEAAIRADEREACKDAVVQAVKEGLQAAIATEREAILKLADSLGWVNVDDIRARGNT
jgi:hypothetical protein